MNGAQAAVAPAAAQGSSRPQIDDWSATLLRHRVRFKAQVPKTEAANATAKAARDDLNAIVEHGATDLGITNEKFRELMKKGDLDIVEIGEDRAVDERALKAMGKLVQAGLDFSKRDTAADLAIWFQRGYADGVAGAPQRTDCDGVFLQEYLTGFSAGQAVLILGLARGEELEKLKGQPQISDPEDLNDDDGDEEDEDEDEETRLAAAADKLKREGFLDTGDKSGDEGAEGKQPAPASSSKPKAVH